jgi:hypothetical protein
VPRQGGGVGHHLEADRRALAELFAAGWRGSRSRAGS